MNSSTGDFRDPKYLKRKYPCMTKDQINYMLKFSKSLAANTKQIRDGFNRSSHHIECDSSWHYQCARGSHAFVPLLGNSMHFCPSFFGLSALEQAQTVLHEGSHLFASNGHSHSSYLDAPDDANWIEDLVVSTPFGTLNRVARNISRDIHVDP